VAGEGAAQPLVDRGVGGVVMDRAEPCQGRDVVEGVVEDLVAGEPIRVAAFEDARQDLLRRGDEVENELRLAAGLTALREQAGLPSASSPAAWG
jgi:hypothetical protein